MTFTTIRAAVAFTACLLAAPAVLAQAAPPADGPGFGGPDMPCCDERGPGPGPGPDFGMPPGGPGFLHGLDLSEAQQDRVFAILHAQVPQRRELEKAERHAHDALHALAGAELDQARAASTAQAFGQAIADQELLQLRTDAQLMAVLTPAQRAQLEQRRAGRGQPDGKRAGKDAGKDKTARKDGK